MVRYNQVLEYLENCSNRISFLNGGGERKKGFDFSNLKNRVAVNLNGKTGLHKLEEVQNSFLDMPNLRYLSRESS